MQDVLCEHTGLLQASYVPQDGVLPATQEVVQALSEKYLKNHVEADICTNWRSQSIQAALTKYRGLGSF